VQLSLAFLCLLFLAAEAALCVYFFSPDRTRLVALASARFFSWRCLFNTLLYASNFSGSRVFRLLPLELNLRRQESDWAEQGGGAGDAVRATRLRCTSITAAVLAPVAQMAASFALLFDVLLGLLLQGMILTLTLVPLLKSLHSLLLFGGGVTSSAVEGLEKRRRSYAHSSSPELDEIRIEKEKVPMKKWWLPSFVTKQLKKTTTLTLDDTVTASRMGGTGEGDDGERDLRGGGTGRAAAAADAAGTTSTR
jgi:hypothetical protein